MPTVAFCSTIHPAALPFFDAFAHSLVTAARGKDAVAVLAVDGVALPEAARSVLEASMPAVLVGVPPGTSPAGARRVMLGEALKSQADIFVCVDSDDQLLAGAVDEHIAALTQAEVSYGDMQISGSETFFADSDVPEQLSSSDAILRRNFLGFTNTALRRDAVAFAASRLPGSVVAADWWLFTTLLDNGIRARRTRSPVTRYRLHDENTLGPRADPERRGLLRRCGIVRSHYAALPVTAERSAADRSVAALTVLLEENFKSIAAAVAAACSLPGVWYDDISRLADALGTSRQ